MIKWFVISFFSILVLQSCQVQKPVTVENINQYIESHNRVAILPFKVKFSDDYKAISQRGRAQANWVEQERIAGLDMQKECFKIFSKKAIKKNWGITAQDFLTTNKMLEQEGIRFSALSSADKIKVGRLLGVDAVIWAESEMLYDMSGWRNRNGMQTRMYLYDIASGQLIWDNSSLVDVNSRLDSPQSIAGRTVDQLISALPYLKNKSKDY